MEIMETKQVEATKANVELAINKIKEYAQEKGYQVLGDFKEDSFFAKLVGSDKPKFESKNQEKVFRKLLWRMENKISMKNANWFLRLYAKVFKLEKAPRVEYSEKELKIKEARKAWKKMQLEADRLQAVYKTEKGDFYKKK
jgi:hypothetical protein